MVKVMLAFPSASRPTRTRLIVFSGLPEQLGSSYTNNLQLSVWLHNSRDADPHVDPAFLNLRIRIPFFSFPVLLLIKSEAGTTRLQTLQGSILSHDDSIVSVHGRSSSVPTIPTTYS
jgi:hypothetical protein